MCLAELYRQKVVSLKLQYISVNNAKILNKRKNQDKKNSQSGVGKPSKMPVWASWHCRRWSTASSPTIRDPVSDAPLPRNGASITLQLSIHYTTTEHPLHDNGYSVVPLSALFKATGFCKPLTVKYLHGIPLSLLRIAQMRAAVSCPKILKLWPPSYLDYIIHRNVLEFQEFRSFRSSLASKATSGRAQTIVLRQGDYIRQYPNSKSLLWFYCIDD